MSSSAGKTSGGNVSEGLEPSTEAFSDELDEVLSTDCDITTVSFAFDEASSDDKVDLISADFCSSDIGISAADKNAVNREEIFLIRSHSLTRRYQLLIN